jgi:hypothetical protein
MTDVYIYGDSFADPNWNESHNCKFVWPVELAKHYRVHNHALKGTGPEYSIQRLMETHPAPNSVCIFVVSDVNRLNLQDFWENDHEQVHMLDVAAKRIRHPGYSFVRQLYQHYLTDHSHIARTAAAIGAVNSLTAQYRRVLIWPIGTVTQQLRTDPSVTLITQGLVDLSEAEWINSRSGSPYLDPRPNHFSEINHRLLYQQITKWIDHGEAPQPQQLARSIA